MRTLINLLISAPIRGEERSTCSLRSLLLLQRTVRIEFISVCLSLALGKDSSENLLPLFNRTKWVRIVINLAEIYRRMRHRFSWDRGPFRKHEEEAEKGNFHLHRGLSRRGEMWNGRRWYYGTEAIAQNDASESPARQSTWV